MKRKFLEIQNQNLIIKSIWLLAIIFSSCTQKTNDNKITGIEHQILEICKTGINSNCILEGDSISKKFIRNIKEFENKNGIENWIILREMGGFCNWKTKERNAKNVSTFIYDDYFLYFKISTIFSELNRITNNQFKYEVIKEFGATYNIEDEPINQDFWENIDSIKGEANYLCKYKIMGEEMNLNYTFLKRNWTALNSEFVKELLSKLEEIFQESQITYLEPEEFLTFVALNKDKKNKFKKDLNINLN